MDEAPDVPHEAPGDPAVAMGAALGSSAKRTVRALLGVAGGALSAGRTIPDVPQEAPGVQVQV